MSRAAPPAVSRRLLAATGAAPLLAAASRSAAAQNPAQNEPPLFQRGDEGRKLWAMGVQVTLRAMGEATGGSYAMFEDLVLPGVSNPAHTHTREVETWYMLDGELDWFIGDRSLKAKTGDFLHTPRGVPHRFGNSSDRPARMLLTYAPAGFEHWFLEVGTPAGAGAPPPPHPGPEQIKRAVEAASRYGVQFVT